MANAAIAAAITPQLLNYSTFYVDSAVAARARAGTVFSGVYGQLITDQLALPGTPVKGSIIRWSATVPAGTTLDVFTSINNGASWEPSENGGHIARLQPGNTVTRSIIAKVIFSRSVYTATSPKLITLELEVSCNSGTFAMVPIGHGMIDKVVVQTSVSGGTTGGGGGAGVVSRGGGQTGGGTSVKIHVIDPSRWIKLAAWQAPFTIPAEMNYSDAVVMAVRDRLPSQELFSITSTTRTTPTEITFGSDQATDAWQDIRELAASYGFECFFDAAGVFVLQPIPDPRYGEAVWKIDQASNPVVTDIKWERADDKIVNYVVAKGESVSSKNPISTYSINNDPHSRTSVDKIGIRVARITFSQITDPDQLQEASDGVLYNSLGLSDTVTISMVPMPALEPSDIVELNLPEPGIVGKYMIQSMTTPLSPAESQVLVLYRQTDSEAI